MGKNRKGLHYVVYLRIKGKKIEHEATGVYETDNLLNINNIKKAAKKNGFGCFVYD